MPTPAPIALTEARANGDLHYFTGIPCIKGHLSKRSTKKQICLECQRDWQKSARKRDPAEFAARARRKLYGLTPEAFEEMLSAQNNLCSICHDPFNEKGPHVDHDHTTGAVRGLLCGHCNLMLGHARDNVETLTRAIEYLRG